MGNNPNDADAYFNRGLSKDESGDHQGAIEDYTKAIELCLNKLGTDDKRKLIESYSNRGNSKQTLRKYKKAIYDYTKVIELCRKNPKTCKTPKLGEIYFNRANSKIEIKKYQAAIEDYNYTTAIESDLNYVDVYYSRGFCKAKLRNYQGAIDDYDEAIKLCLNNTETDNEYRLSNVYSNRGVSKHNLEDYQEAIDDYTKAIKPYLNNSEPESKRKLSEFYSNRGVSKYKLKAYKKAIDDCDKAIKNYPGRAGAYLNRGNSKAELKDHQGAIKDFFKLTKLTKTNPEKDKDEDKALYQYMPIDSKKLLSLINREVYFADYQILNDPFECYFMQNQSINKSLTKKEITARILSLTHNPGSHLMYSHYANSHTGICVEYDINFKKLKGKEKISYGGVRYEEKHGAENLKDLYMLKHEQWAYEKEYRIVRFDNKKFMKCEKIKSITFAFKCSENHKKIIYALMSKLSDIKYYQIKEEKDSNRIYRNEIKKPTKKVSGLALSKLILESKIPH